MASPRLEITSQKSPLSSLPERDMVGGFCEGTRPSGGPLGFMMRNIAEGWFLGVTAGDLD